MSRLHLFIDTNIFLNLYHYSDDDLEELRKIIVLLENNRLVLYTTTQLWDEFRRNRDEKLKEALESIKKIITSTQFPNICKTYDEYADIKRALRDFHTAKDILANKLLEDILEKRLKADIIIEEIFNKSKIFPIDNDIVSIAKQRFDLGNPPWKKWSYWDAINWELLLHNINSTTAEEIDTLYFITQDKDYISNLDPTRFNSFLQDEWSNKKWFPVKLYSRLTDFFRDKFPDIRLAQELHKTLLIQQLCDSFSFMNTKNTLRRLLAITDFTTDELHKIIQGAVSNNQIYWISEQVKDMLNALLGSRRNEIEPTILGEFDALFNPEPEQEEEISIEDIPF